MAEQITVYCDESGNDGPNYLNRASPFYVLAGWAVPEVAIVEATVIVEQLRRAEFNTGTSELKYRQFARNDKRRLKLEQLIERLHGQRLLPVYIVAEKRYCVAAKIVETFLDPYYNKLALNGMTWNIDVKQEIANTLYENLPDVVLEQFANAYRTPTANDLMLALTAIENVCALCINPEIARFFHGSHESLAEIADAEVSAASTWGKGSDTLNLPCLISFIMMIEKMGRSGLFRTKKIVHDEIYAYQATYEAVFSHFKNVATDWCTLPGSSLGLGSVITVDNFEIQRSIEQPLIQAADLLAGAVNAICISLCRNETLSQHELNLTKLLLTPMLFQEHTIAFPICSDRMLSRIDLAVRTCFPEFHDAGKDEFPAKTRMSVSSTLARKKCGDRSCVQWPRL